MNEAHWLTQAFLCLLSIALISAGMFCFLLLGFALEVL